MGQRRGVGRAPAGRYAGLVNVVPPLPAITVKPKLRGVSHEVAFFIAIVLAVLLGLKANGAAGISGAVVFGVSVSLMFGTSALYHRVNWSVCRFQRHTLPSVPRELRITFSMWLVLKKVTLSVAGTLSR